MSPTLAHRTATPQRVGSISPATTLNAKQIDFENRDVGEYGNTCGYLANGGYPITCGTSSACYTWPEKSVQGCCHISESLSGCTIPTSCVPYDIYDSCKSCEVDPLAVTCSDTANPYCLERWYSYEKSSILTEYSCWKTPYSSLVWVTTEPSTSSSLQTNFTTATTTITPQASPEPTSGAPPSDQMPTGKPTLYPIKG